MICSCLAICDRSLMSDSDRFEQLASCSDPDFENFYRIYADSISERERKPKAWICEMAGRSDYKIFLLKRSGSVIGFSMLFLPQEETFALLEYMAIAEEHRNAGLGGDIFRRTIQTSGLSRKDNPRPTLLEVDSDREQTTDRELRARRLQFYRRLGCLRFAGLHYILPLSGEGPVPEMDLMIYPASNQREIPKRALERWLSVIYQRVYNCSPDDARITRMLTGIPEPARLE